MKAHRWAQHSTKKQIEQKSACWLKVKDNNNDDLRVVPFLDKGVVLHLNKHEFSKLN